MKFRHIADDASACIMATKQPREPNAILEQIICDADTYNFGTKDFKETNKKVFAELNYYNSEAITKAAFDKKTYEMLSQHEYFTSYCQELLDERKQKHINKLQKKVDEFDRRPWSANNGKRGNYKGNANNAPPYLVQPYSD